MCSRVVSNPLPRSKRRRRIDLKVTVGVVFEFDAAKNQMIQKRGGRERVFTKEK